MTEAQTEIHQAEIQQADAPAGAVAASDNERGGANIDWEFASSFGRKIARPGPRVTRYTMEQTQAELAAASRRAEAPVREVTGLADGLPVPAARILDRSGWIDAAASSMPSMLGIERGGRGVMGKVAGVEAGGLLAFLSSAILGQYDPFSPDPETGEPGVLMLVAPNIIAVERQLRVVPSDFRLWVCLHEVTHRVQFSANPWLPGYMQDNVALLTGDAGESTADLVGRITESLRSGRSREKGVFGLMQLVQTPEQYAALERVMVLGTLLEGHADHVMDAVGPAHVPTVATIRAAFDRRRTRPQNPIQRVIRALIGMDAKMSQYIRGKAFVDAVVDEVGMAAFNTVWTSPETMPTMAEIGEPHDWVARVL
ncbi:MAG: zinc-dependent metalloprotease [Gordonia sp. (in: high G+C Gram-positive bacteria)]|uniref:zinc-dependent metalloprotease n=1 Tax=Gordonia sp. (in: high G+C Gram-positive bacteria) TaxID=84139 RepID=UPI003BB59D6F